MIDLRRLAVLRAVATHGSVTGAARVLSYSASAVSAQLAALERDLGVALVERRGRRITMTEHGMALARRAGVLLELAEEVEAGARHATGLVSPVRIAVFPHAVDWLLSPTLEALADARPPEVQVVVVGPETAVRLLRHGAVDIAVVYQDAAASVPGLAATTLVHAPLRLACASSSRYPPHTLAGTAALSWVLPADGTVARAVVDRALGVAAVSPRMTATASTLQAVASMTAAGLGVSLLPEFAVVPFAARLWAREPDDVVAALTVSVLRPYDGASAGAELLSEALRRTADGLGTRAVVPPARHPPMSRAGGAVINP